MICPKCKYEWVTRVAKPKACPECGVRFSRMKKKVESAEQSTKQPQKLTDLFPDGMEFHGTKLVTPPMVEGQDSRRVTSHAQPTHCPDCKNPIPECKCEDKSIELEAKHDTRVK